METTELLTAARDKFRAGLWQETGWGGSDGLELDRRCVVGTLRWISKTGHGDMSSRADEFYSPWFFAYEEGIFEVVALLFEDDYLRSMNGWNERIKADGFDPVVEVRSLQKQGGYTEHIAIMQVLEQAEAVLMTYNDGTNSSRFKMIQLMDKAVERIKEKRVAIAAEHDQRAVKDAALATGIDESLVTIASRDDEAQARAEYEAEHGKNWDPWTHDADGTPLPPVWAYKAGKGWSKGAKSLKTRVGGKLKKTVR